MRKLTKEEEHKLDSFMGKCIRENVQLGILSNRVGVNTTMNIQELYNSNPGTLRVFGEKLESLEQKNGGRFSTNDPYKVGGVVPVTEMMDIIELIIVENEYKVDTKRKNNAIKKLETELEDYKTPDEKRSEKMAELAALKANLVNAEALPTEESVKA